MLRTNPFILRRVKGERNSVVTPLQGKHVAGKPIYSKTCQFDEQASVAGGGAPRVKSSRHVCVAQIGQFAHARLAFPLLALGSAGTQPARTRLP